jgi:signal recognition particle subunit SEC65
VRYSIARYAAKSVERAYRTYVTATLRLIPQRMYPDKRWEELFRVRAQPERTAEEIIDHVAKRLEE